MLRLALFLLTHGVALAVGFALGVYFLPILTAPASPDRAMLEASAADASYSATLTRDLPGSDFLHWGEGTIAISPTEITHMGSLAPGPDYKLYLTPEFVTHEDDFAPIKGASLQVGDIKSFDGFLVTLPEGTDIDAYKGVLVWCEAFGEFITAAPYR